MKSQQGFIASGSIPFLIGTLLLSGTALAGSDSTKNEVVAIHDQASSTLASASTAAVAVATSPETPVPQQQPNQGTPYINGGHFGNENSDAGR